jgi:hypothetical protein
MEWQEAVEIIKPYVVKIRTPSYFGTGFMCFEYPAKTHYGIATARHVVSNAKEWQEPIKIIYQQETVFYSAVERIILDDEEYDSSVILVPPPEAFNFPSHFVPFIPTGDTLPIGTEVGWMGYPSVDPDTLCFFTGRISAHRATGYYIDGVSINGVSGGPVFHKDEAGNLRILGIVTQYHANRSRPGEALPGLMYAHAATRFNSMIDDLNTYYAQQAQLNLGAEPTDPAPHQDT